VADQLHSALTSRGVLCIAAMLLAAACGESAQEPAPAPASGTVRSPTNPTAAPSAPPAPQIVALPAEPVPPAPSTQACAPARSGTIGDRSVKLKVGGRDRTFELHVPKGYDGTKGTMLLLNFHGYMMDGPSMRWVTKLDEYADLSGFIVAYPDGLSKSWNAGDCCGEAWKSNGVDDVEYARAIVSHLSAEYCVDPTLVYASGFSNGGFLSHRLACEASDVFAAIASVAGAMGIRPSDCLPSRPVPVLQVHGTADMVVRYDGGHPFVPLGPVEFRSVDETLSTWRQRNGCLGSAETTYQKGEVTCQRWGTCKRDADVELCTVTEGGHQWPGGNPITSGGHLSGDVSASAAMLKFFAAHPMR
jgi:polyhydroxybutyrate depolymerase